MSEPLIQTPCLFGENGNFMLEREIGSGGMGGVYMGRDKMLDRPVAVKVMLKEYGSDAAFVEKFKKEAQAAARLIHPNIAQVYSFGLYDGMPYIAMELASGGSLYSLMNAAPGKTDIQRVLKICQQTMLALQCATDQGIIHGDVKPENILLDANGNAKLVDFGLAAMQKDTKEIWGTPYYISPEKVKKEELDFRSDMYSLGATLYHALTGVAPFEGEDTIAVVKKRFEGRPKKPSEIRPDISPAIDALVMKMIECDRENRYPSFEALRQAFVDVLTTGLTQKMPALPKEGAGSSSSQKKPFVVRGRKVTFKKPSAESSSLKRVLDEEKKREASDEEEDDEEESGSLGLKVVLFVLGGLLAIGAIIGGLVWYTKANEQAQKDEFNALVVTKMDEARKSIAKTQEAVETFDRDFKEFAARAETSCEKYTTELSKLLPDFAAEMKPPQSAELLAVLAQTNAPASAASPTNGAVTVSQAVAPVPTATVTATAPTAAPTGEATLPPPAPEPKELPKAVEDMKGLWLKAYSCQASQIKISRTAQAILALCEEANKYQTQSEENAKALGNLSLTVKEKYEEMRSSSDVTNVKKALAHIHSRGEKVISQTIVELKVKKAEAARAEKEAREKAAEEARLAKKAAERAALVTAETESIQQQFDALSVQGCFRQLNWKLATDRLNQASENFKTAEGQLMRDLQLRKVNDMKKVQDLFIAKLKNHVFSGRIKSALRNGKVVDVNEREISVIFHGKRKPIKVAWQKFYRDYPGNFNEIINHYIINGRKNSSLNLREWADVMTGAALTMRLVCAEVVGAGEKAEQMVREVIAQFPEYEKTMNQIFPDISSEAPAAEPSEGESSSEDGEEEEE